MRLAEQAQQAIITYEKIMGTETSVIESLRKWLDDIYLLRETYYAYKNTCYDGLKNYIVNDVKDQKWQENYNEHQDAADALGDELDRRYAWLKWVCFFCY